MFSLPILRLRGLRGVGLSGATGSECRRLSKASTAGAETGGLAANARFKRNSEDTFERQTEQAGDGAPSRPV